MSRVVHAEEPMPGLDSEVCSTIFSYRALWYLIALRLLLELRFKSGPTLSLGTRRNSTSRSSCLVSAPEPQGSPQGPMVSVPRPLPPDSPNFYPLHVGRVLSWPPPESVP